MFRAWRFLRMLALRFYDDRCLIQASALAYTTLLSLVPLLALMFAALRGLGSAERLEHWLLTQLGLSSQVTERIIGFVGEMNAGTLTSLGVIALLFTAISVLGNVEASLNHIWRIHTGRVWWRKLSDYMSVVLLTPFLLLAGFGATSFLAEQETLKGLLANEIIGDVWAQGLRLVPYGFNVLALAIVYTVMPNRRPHFRAILIAAILAGISWQIVQIAYVQLQIGVVRANVVYGALAQVPVTLVWVYVSWTIVLAGAEVAAMVEFGVDAVELEGAPPPQWAVATQALLRAAERFEGEGGGIEPRALAREIQVETGVVERVAERLRVSGFLVALAGSRGLYALGRDPAAIDLGDVAASLVESAGARQWDPRLGGLLGRAGRGQQQVFANLSLADLLAEKHAPEATVSSVAAAPAEGRS
ncbi:MAG: YhjD/YihY/BrkB family envelope integrity protein [Candidatus Binatia bacterium]|nr:YhjD/YihY/BrkB family envelope integrity protein [Candidatus Binatia bacterium]